MCKTTKESKYQVSQMYFLQENTVQILSADMIPDLIAGYNFHPCKKGKCLFLVPGKFVTALQEAWVLNGFPW